MSEDSRENAQPFGEYDGIDHQMTLSDGSNWKSPQSWWRHQWKDSQTLRAAAEQVRYHENWFFSHHIVLTYAPTSVIFTEYVNRKTSDGTYVTDTHAWDDQNRSLMALVRKHHRSRWDGTSLSTQGVANHLERFLRSWRSHLGAMTQKKTRGKIYYLSAIETDPFHIHLLTMNTGFLESGRQTVYGSWNRGFVDVRPFVDDDHKRKSVGYIYKTFGEDDAETRFSQFHLPRRSE
jgi:hypothetical protein